MSVIAIVVLLQGAARAIELPPPDFKTRVDYMVWFEKAVRGNQPESENGASEYAKAFKDTPEGKTAEAAQGFCGPRTDPDESKRAKHPQPWDPKEHPEWEQAYQGTKAQCEAWRNGARKGYAYFGPVNGQSNGKPVRFFEALMPELAKMRALGKGISENAWRAESGKLNQINFRNACKANLRAAQQLGGHPMIIAQLVGAGLRHIVYDDLRSLLMLPAVAPADRASVAQMLRENDPPLPAMRWVFAGELAMDYDVLQSAADAAQPPSSIEEFRAAFDLVRSGKLKPEDCAQSLRKWFDAFLQVMEKPYAADSLAKINDVLEAAKRDNGFVGAMLPAMDRAYVLLLRAETVRRATRLLYEIYVYRDKNGKFPGTLSDLDAKSLGDLLIDPFSNKPFAYKPSGDGFTLYSVAQNAKDDGGKHDSKWGDEKPDTDFVFWPIPEK